MKPHVIDVTELLHGDSTDNAIEYRGLFQGKTPNPKRSTGYIMMESSLVFQKGGRSEL